MCTLSTSDRACHELGICSTTSCAVPEVLSTSSASTTDTDMKSCSAHMLCSVHQYTVCVYVYGVQNWNRVLGKYIW